MDKPTPKDIKRKFTGQTNAVAAKCTVEIILTYTPSTRLYSVCIILFIMIGTDRVKSIL